jgi:hypothetical protein
MRIFIATTASTFSMTKHLDFRLHFMRDAHQGGRVKLYHVPSSEMLVDTFTKLIANPQFEKIVSSLMRCSVEYIPQSAPQSGAVLKCLSQD